MSEDFLKARNPAADLFSSQLGDIQLPQHSKMYMKPQKKPTINNQKQSKYQQDDNDDFLNIELEAESNIMKKPQEQLTSQSNNSKKSTNNNEGENRQAPKSKIVRAVKRKAHKKQQVTTKIEVDIDNQIGQIAQWAEKGAKNNSDDEDFNEAEKVGQSEQQVQIRKKIQQKLKHGFNQKPNAGSNLKAKAEQLKQQNDKRLHQIKQQSVVLQQTNSFIIKKEQNNAGQTSHNNSNINLLDKNIKRQQFVQNNEDDDDIWDKVNEKTLNQIKQVKQKRKQMNLKTVLQYYQTQFQVNQKDIEDVQIGGDLQSEEDNKIQEMGFLQKLCSCFKSQPKQKRNKTKYNLSIAKRLVAISKKHLTNGQEQYFMLRQIWNKLTGQQFSRYGNHWNKIGFQGRDPATDLRSTGVLSLLQWIQFIETHPSQSVKYCNWSIQFEFPLALTHIKLTAAYLDLLAKGLIKYETWQEFQKPYNCLVINMFKRLMQKFQHGQALGSLVQQQARSLKKQYIKLLSQYQKQYEKKKNK